MEDNSQHPDMLPQNMILYFLLLLVYTLFLTFFVFRQIVWINFLLAAIHIIVLRLLGLRFKRIFTPLKKLVPFLVIIFLTSGFFTGGNEIFSIDLLFTKLKFTYEGLDSGLIAVSAFLAIASINGFYQLKKIELSLLKLTQKIPFLLPFFLAQKYFNQEEKELKKQLNKKQISKERFIKRRLEEAFYGFSKFVKKEKIEIKSERIVLITVISILLFSLKIAKVLPGIPFASGQRLVVTIPFLFFLSRKSGGWASTIASVNFSLLALVFGQQGQLGMIEMFRNILLGFAVDLFAKKLPSNNIILFLWLSFVGGLLGFLYAFSSLFFVSLLKVPSIIYLFLAPRFVFNIIFGTISGPLSFFLISKGLMIEKKAKKKYNTKRKYGKTKS